MGGDTSQHYWCLARTRTCVHTHTHTHVRTPLRPEAPRGGRRLGHAAGRPSRRSSVTPRTAPRLAARASPGPGTPTPRPTWLAPHTLTSTHRPPPQVPSLPAAFGAGRPALVWSSRVPAPALLEHRVDRCRRAWSVSARTVQGPESTELPSHSVLQRGAECTAGTSFVCFSSE